MDESDETDTEKESLLPKTNRRKRFASSSSEDEADKFADSDSQEAAEEEVDEDEEACELLANEHGAVSSSIDEVINHPLAASSGLNKDDSMQLISDLSHENLCKETLEISQQEIDNAAGGGATGAVQCHLHENNEKYEVDVGVGITHIAAKNQGSSDEMLKVNDEIFLEENPSRQEQVKDNENMTLMVDSKIMEIDNVTDSGEPLRGGHECDEKCVMMDKGYLKIVPEIVEACESQSTKDEPHMLDVKTANENLKLSLSTPDIVTGCEIQQKTRCGSSLDIQTLVKTGELEPNNQLRVSEKQIYSKTATYSNMLSVGCNLTASKSMEIGAILLKDSEDFKNSKRNERRVSFDLTLQSIDIDNLSKCKEEEEEDEVKECPKKSNENIETSIENVKELKIPLKSSSEEEDQIPQTPIQSSSDDEELKTPIGSSLSLQDKDMQHDTSEDTPTKKLSEPSNDLNVSSSETLQIPNKLDCINLNLPSSKSMEIYQKNKRERVNRPFGSFNDLFLIHGESMESDRKWFDQKVQSKTGIHELTSFESAEEGDEKIHYPPEKLSLDSPTAFQTKDVLETPSKYTTDSISDLNFIRSLSIASDHHQISPPYRITKPKGRSSSLSFNFKMSKSMEMMAGHLPSNRAPNLNKYFGSSKDLYFSSCEQQEEEDNPNEPQSGAGFREQGPSKRNSLSSKFPIGIPHIPKDSLDLYHSAMDLPQQGINDSTTVVPPTPEMESGYFEKSDSLPPPPPVIPLASNEEVNDNTAEEKPKPQYDQAISESLRDQLNRFDFLIETMDQRNARNMASNAAERGYWSTIFGQASEIASLDEIPPENKAHRALELLEDYHSRLSEPQDRALRIAIERVIRIFKSRLFQALLDIQEFYELTLLDDSKTIQQKTVETLQIASKWEQDGHTVKITDNQTVKVAAETDINQTKNEQNLTDVLTDTEQQQQTNGRQQPPGSTEINSVSPYEVCFSSYYKM
ncbi:uncharacterized protein LOC101892219 [Musca domestica]|uniref:Uncharacterized protein LOC101892219 n=1 Tax=Musca domestica TaxID=7370 RepID=A0A9J7CQH6_MUSDO|nr:uncharacterized protein LOC101892219 [Musca domestica]